MQQPDDLNVQQLIYNLRDLGFYGIETTKASNINDDPQLETLNQADVDSMLKAYPKLKGLFMFINEKAPDLEPANMQDNL